MTTKRKQFTREFKLEAVRLVEEGGQQVAQVARDLGIHDSVLRRWRDRILAEGAGGRAHPSFRSRGRWRVEIVPAPTSRSALNRPPRTSQSRGQAPGAEPRPVPTRDSNLPS